MVRCWWLVFLISLGACFSPSFNDNAIQCGPNGACPPGLDCVAGVCRAEGTPTPQDGGIDASPTADLTVTRSGLGSGTVTSSVGGINCGSACMASLPVNTVVTLTATPTSQSTFTGWSGSSCTSDPVCTVTLDGDKALTAEFGQVLRTITVVPNGNGTGTVTSTPAGITCPGTCTLKVPDGDTVTLTGAASSGSTFLGWSGATTCTGTTPCTFTVNGDMSVNAGFALENSLVIVKLGNGTGTVSSSPAGIDCGADCDQAYLAGTSVTLTATADSESTFTGWTNGCGLTNPCTITINASVMVSASFTLKKYSLSVATNGGTGTGTVTSFPTGITCPGDCTADFNSGQTVTLTPMADASSNFTGFSGACVGATCSVTMDAMKAVTAAFALKTYVLTLNLPINGRVVATGINCGGANNDCTETYTHGTPVSLDAQPATGYAFFGWSGGPCNGTNMDPCVSNITSTQSNITANFTITQHTLMIDKAGMGTGTVTGIGINCGADCDQTFNYGDVIQLQATAGMGSNFAGFTGGGCNGEQVCLVTVDMAKTVTATFDLNRYPLTVMRTGAGTGSVTSSPPGITCGGGGTAPDCVENYAYGTAVTLTAAAPLGSTFMGWSSNCIAAGLSCTITINQVETVTATFEITQHTLTVVKEGTGVGTVSGPGIACPGDCTQAYNYNTPVTLTAQVTAPNVFVGWLGACSGNGACVVNMNADHTVRAVFSPPPNRMFVTSQTFVIGNLGGLAGADAKCQASAQAASLPGTYVAWLSSSTADAIDRLGTASGWVRVDGKPFANTKDDLANNRLFTPARITETGADIGESEAVTATSTTGGFYSGAGDCGGFTDTNGSGARVGATSATSGPWNNANSFPCNFTARLYCFGVNNAATVIPQVPGAVRRAFMKIWLPGGGIADADASCQADATANNLPGTYKALLPTTTASAISRFITTTSSAPWVRVDNVPVLVSAFAWGAAATTFFDTPPNVSADGAIHFDNVAHWGGASSLTAVGSNGTTCSNWTSPTQSAGYGISAWSRISTFQATNTTQCTFNNATIVCLQE